MSKFSTTMKQYLTYILSYLNLEKEKGLAPVVQRADIFISRITHYPMHKMHSLEYILSAGEFFYPLDKVICSLDNRGAGQLLIFMFIKKTLVLVKKMSECCTICHPFGSVLSPLTS